MESLKKPGIHSLTITLKHEKLLSLTYYITQYSYHVKPVSATLLAPTYYWQPYHPTRAKSPVSVPPATRRDATLLLVDAS